MKLRKHIPDKPFNEYSEPDFVEPVDDRQGLVPFGVYRKNGVTYYRYLNLKQDTKGIVIVAKAGQGKTTIINITLATALSQIGIKPGVRAILQDPKQENARILRSMGVPYKALNPYLKHFAAFDISSVVTNKSKAQIFTLTLMLKTELSQLSEFWDQQVFRLISSVIESLIVMKAQKIISYWGIRHLILAVDAIVYTGDEVDFGDFARLIRFCPQHEAVMQSLQGKTGRSVVQSTRGVLAIWSVIAARNDRATERVTLADWNDNVFLFGVSMENEAVMNFLNRFIFTEIANYLRGLPEQLPDDPPRKVYNIIDEGLSLLPLPQIDKLMEIGRSKDVCTIVTLLNIAGLQHKPEFRTEGTKAFLDLFRHYIVLGVSRSDAEFLVNNVFGYRSGTRYQPVYDYKYVPHPANPKKLQKQRIVVDYKATPFVEPRVTVEGLVNIPPANAHNGTTGYFYSPQAVSQFCTYTAEDYYTLCPYVQYLNEVDDSLDALIDVDDPSLYEIRPFDAEERCSLGL
ncbi:MAG: type IV secretion system DNA-binding domain-containing protein [Pleurocapsa sp. MO_226.B13]|nr:type IV secretion system DNA-binding domain-containing protein [Pleurocapsa sp. MO_226.B13]